MQKDCERPYPDQSPFGDRSLVPPRPCAACPRRCRARGGGRRRGLHCLAARLWSGSRTASPCIWPAARPAA